MGRDRSTELRANRKVRRYVRFRHPDLGEHVAWVRALALEGIRSANEWRVASVLFDAMVFWGRTADQATYLGQQTIADELDVDARTVRRHVAALRARGWLETRAEHVVREGEHRTVNRTFPVGRVAELIKRLVDVRFPDVWRELGRRAPRPRPDAGHSTLDSELSLPSHYWSVRAPP